ncbi:hypothetical protein JFU37_17810 [Pseudomonas sp. TH41]|uniref:hypothetical protein n=1 Tax=Pseudomonas sp. TH41 TaxID=2796405 RepID=UPI001913370E|nr:hypothetical protein [Pseudomonas sp. TH41]MBK5354352.1 hypothetical protein [Pseudomonas sp. TH41]
MSGEQPKQYADLLFVGASLLAMDVNDNAYCLEKCVAFEFIASKLAPTEHTIPPVGAAEGCDLLILMLLQTCRPFPRGRMQALRRGHLGKDAEVAAPGPECVKTGSNIVGACADECWLAH